MTTHQDVLNAIHEIDTKLKSLLAEIRGDTKSTEPWAAVANETNVFDQAKAEKWNKDIDTLLLYASLFSAVVATFAVESIKTSGSEPDTPEKVGKGAHNSLWFVSLILALITASAGTLVKQWIQQYLEEDFDSSPREHIRMRQHRYDGLRRWRVLFLVGMLPVLLRISFVLFGAGLAIRLNDFDQTAAIALSVFGIIWLFLSLSATILPSYYSNCPYKSPESLLMLNIVLLVKRRFGGALNIRGGSTSSVWRWESWQSRERRAVDEESETMQEAGGATVWSQLKKLVKKRPIRKAELEVQALVTASTELAPSNPSLAADIEVCAQDFKVTEVMRIVHRVGWARMRRTDIKPVDWRKLWNYMEQYTGKDQSLSNITKRGTTMLLKMVADAVQRDDENSITEPAIACVTTLLARKKLEIETRLRVDIERAIAKLLGAVRKSAPDDAVDAVNDEIPSVDEAKDELSNEATDKEAGSTSDSAGEAADSSAGNATGEVADSAASKTVGARSNEETGTATKHVADGRNAAFGVFLAAVGLCSQVKPDEGAFETLMEFDFTPCQERIRGLLRSATWGSILLWALYGHIDPSITSFVILKFASLSPMDAALEEDLQKFFGTWAAYFDFFKGKKQYPEDSPWASKVVEVMEQAHFDATGAGEDFKASMLAFPDA